MPFHPFEQVLATWHPQQVFSYGSFCTNYQVPDTNYQIQNTNHFKYKVQPSTTREVISCCTASVGSSVDVMASEQYLGTRRLFACLVHHCCALVLILVSWYLLLLVLVTYYMVSSWYLVLGSWYLLLFPMPCHCHHCSMGDWPARGRCPALVGLSTP